MGEMLSFTNSSGSLNHSRASTPESMMRKLPALTIATLWYSCGTLGPSAMPIVSETEESQSICTPFFRTTADARCTCLVTGCSRPRIAVADS